MSALTVVTDRERELAEREACARVCEDWGHECHGEGRDGSEAFDCADAIRAMNDDKGGAA